MNSPGTVDSDYRGEVKVILINHGKKTFVIENGERIAQGVLANVVGKMLVNFDKVDSLNKPSHYEDYHIKASRLGISACLHMEVDVEENQIKEETKMIHNLIENNDTIIKGVISSCRPEKNDFQDMIQYAEAQQLIKGFRRVLHVAPDNTAGSDQFKNNIKMASDPFKSDFLTTNLQPLSGSNFNIGSS